MKLKRWIVFGFSLFSLPVFAADTPFEISAGFSYSRSQYSERSYTWNRRYGFSVGFNITTLTQLEFGYQSSTTRNNIENYEDTTFEDKVLSLTLLQNLLPKTSPVQPYLKGGVGQLNRDAGGSYTAFGTRPTSRYDTVTVILGAGARVYLMNNFAIRTEATSYLSGGYLRKWQDNIAITVGLSLYL